MNKGIFFLTNQALANQATMLLDCFAFLCNLIPLLLNLKYMTKQKKIKCVLLTFAKQLNARNWENIKQFLRSKFKTCMSP